MDVLFGYHIVFKEGSGKQKEWVLKSKAILEEYEIDWLKGPENLVWAPNIEGLHTEEMAKMVYEELPDPREPAAFDLSRLRKKEPQHHWGRR